MTDLEYGLIFISRQLLPYANWCWDLDLEQRWFAYARYCKGQELGHFVHVVRIHVWKILRIRKQCVVSAPPPKDEFSLNCSVAHGLKLCAKQLEGASYRLSRALSQF